MRSPSILISLSFINLLSLLHLMPQCSIPGIRAQRGDPGAGLGLCFLLQCVEGIKSDILRCWLTLPAAPPPPPGLQLLMYQAASGCFRLSPNSLMLFYFVVTVTFPSFFPLQILVCASFLAPLVSSLKTRLNS